MMPRPTLFDLFRRFHKFSIEFEGEAVDVGILALTTGQSQELLRKASDVRLVAEKNVASQRQLLQDRVKTIGAEKVIEEILQLEQRTVEQVADLAPGEEELSFEEREKKAIERWQESRGKELKEMDADVLKVMLVDRQERTLVDVQVLRTFSDGQLCMMIVDPETRQPMLAEHSHDEKGQPVANWIGNLMTETREKLNDERNKFLDPRNARAVRDVAADPAFLASGASPLEPTDSPGETEKTSQLSLVSS